MDRERWEYTMLKTMIASNREDLSNILEDINKLGADGWELVGSAGDCGRILLFKRKLP